MKKLLLFLTVFLVFGLVIAEEVQVGEYTIEDVTITLFEEREMEPEPEPEPEPEVEKQEEEVVPENKEKPKIFYIQPIAGIGVMMEHLSFTVALDSYFLLNPQGRKMNFYLGTEIGFRYTPYIDYNTSFIEGRIFEVPIQALFVFDAQINPQYSTRLGGWFSFGPNLIWENNLQETNTMEYYTWLAWSTGANITMNNVVIRFGVTGYYTFFDFILAVGYRF